MAKKRSEEAKFKSADQEQTKILDAEALYEKGEYAAAAQAYGDLADIEPKRFPVLFGLGKSLFAAGDINEAATKFSLCSIINPKHADTEYYVGAIAETKGATRQAKRSYKRVLSLQPGHPGATRRLIQMHLKPGSTAARIMALGEGYRFYTRLAQADVSTKYLAFLINSMAFAQRPRALSFFAAGPIVASRGLSLIIHIAAQLQLALLAAPAFILMFATQSNVGLDLILLIPWIIPTLMFWYFIGMLRASTTVYHVRHGYLRIEEGIIYKQVHNFELQRVQDIFIMQTLSNRITGDCALCFKFDKDKSGLVALYGIGTIWEARVLQDAMRELILHLRANGSLKGIIN